MSRINILRIAILIILLIYVKNDENSCLQTDPKNIKDACYAEDNCCYITTRYKYSYSYGCTIVEKDKNKIKERIKELKEQDENIKSINIDCNSSFIKKSFILLLLIFYL